MHFRTYTNTISRVQYKVPQFLEPTPPPYPHNPTKTQQWTNEILSSKNGRSRDVCKLPRWVGGEGHGNLRGLTKTGYPLTKYPFYSPTASDKNWSEIFLVQIHQTLCNFPSPKSLECLNFSKNCILKLFTFHDGFQEWCVLCHTHIFCMILNLRYPCSTLF